MAPAYTSFSSPSSLSSSSSPSSSVLPSSVDKPFHLPANHSMATDIIPLLGQGLFDCQRALAGWLPRHHRRRYHHLRPILSLLLSGTVRHGHRLDFPSRHREITSTNSTLHPRDMWREAIYHRPYHQSSVRCILRTSLCIFGLPPISFSDAHGAPEIDSASTNIDISIDIEVGS